MQKTINHVALFFPSCVHKTRIPQPYCLFGSKNCVQAYPKCILLNQHYNYTVTIINLLGLNKKVMVVELDFADVDENSDFSKSISGFFNHNSP